MKINTRVAQMARAGSSYGQGRGFDSLLWYYAGLAQLGEHQSYKLEATGSNPVPRTRSYS